MALQLDDIVKARAKEKQIESGKRFGVGKEKVLALAPKPFHTDKELAEAAGVSPKTIQYVMRQLESASLHSHKIYCNIMQEITLFMADYGS